MDSAVNQFRHVTSDMDYLRTLGSAAVSSLVQKSGLTLPFTLGPKVTSFADVWNLYEGTKRDDGTPISVFEYTNRTQIHLAKNAVRKLRTIRHPDVVKFIDAVESDTVIYIVTERVRPLMTSLPAWSSRNAREREDWLIWGLHRISVALSFINDSCASTHGNLRVESCFISPSGEWKLGGFELLSTPKDDAAVLYTMGGTIPLASDWAPPEVKSGGYSALKDQHPAAADAYSLGLILHAVFNPNQGPPATSRPPHSPPQPSSRGSIPTSVFPSFKKLLNPKPKARMSAQNFLAVGMAEMGGEGPGFFVTNRLVQICVGLDNFSLGSEADKNAFLRTLKESTSSFPTEFGSYRVLPSLISALEFGGASAAAILPLILQLGNNVPPEDYPSVIIAPLIKLFASPDRGTRMALLDNLPEYADRLDKKSVSDKIWPHLQTGFSDTVAVIREATVKSIGLLSSKFNDRILNNDLLRFLAKLQNDPEASIRTNTCILIGRLGPSLGYNTKRKVLVPAFARALKDPFVHARVAGLMAFMATIDCFDPGDMATKVIPNISPVLIDQEKLVRDQAFKAVELLVKKLEAQATTMPETAISDEPTIQGAFSSSNPSQATLVSSAAGAAGALAGWAISTLGKKLATADMQSNITSEPFTPPLGATSTDISAPTSRPNSSAASLTASTSRITPSASKSKGMQLGGGKVTANVASAALAARLAEEAAVEEGNPWGTDDLIDVNADQDDWGAFEVAPIAESKSVSIGGLEVQDVLEPPQNSVEEWNGDKPVDPWSPDLQNGLSQLQPSEIVDPWGGSGPWKTQIGNDTSGTNSYSTHNRSSSPVRDFTSHISFGQRSTPPRPLSEGWESVEKKDTSPAPLAGSMTKEEKAAEMARRKEERKQRIAQLKEKKKNASAKG